MDGAQSCDRYLTTIANVCNSEQEGTGPCNEASGVSLGVTLSSADLGGSSKYSNENFED